MIRRGIEAAKKEKEVVMAFGSLYLAGDILKTYKTRAFEVVKQIRKEVKERNKAAIMVTHDERMLEFCDKVYRMEDGVLTEQK